MGDVAQILGIGTKRSGGSGGSGLEGFDDDQQPQQGGFDFVPLRKKFRGTIDRVSGLRPPPRAVQLQALPPDIVSELVSIPPHQQHIQKQKPLLLSGLRRYPHDTQHSIQNEQAASVELPPSVPVNPRLVASRLRLQGSQEQHQQHQQQNARSSSSKKNGLQYLNNQQQFPQQPKLPVKPWVYAPFCSSSRTDGLILYHWVRANVEYPDYPYARFDIHLDPVMYTDEEYKLYFDQQPSPLSTGNNIEDVAITAKKEIANKGAAKLGKFNVTASSDLQSKTNESMSKFYWTRNETDILMDLCKRFELRWPVIHDRWMLECSIPRPIEELQHRFYSIAAILLQVRIAKEAAKEANALSKSANEASTNSGTLSSNDAAMASTLLLEAAAARSLAVTDPKLQPLFADIGSGTSNKVFDLEYERKRRQHMEALWSRTKDDEDEEAALRAELKLVEAQLRKLKKVGAHVVNAVNGNVSSVSTTNITANSRKSKDNKNKNAAASGNTSLVNARSQTPVNEIEAENEFPIITSAATTSWNFLPSFAVTPVPGTPYLQSGRLLMPAANDPTTMTTAQNQQVPSINPALLNRMEHLLTNDMKIIPSKLTPTKRICDLYDTVRQDLITLLVFQKNAIYTEGIVQRKRLELQQLVQKRASMTNATQPIDTSTLSAAAAALVSSMNTTRIVADEEALMGITPITVLRTPTPQLTTSPAPINTAKLTPPHPPPGQHQHQQQSVVPTTLPSSSSLAQQPMVSGASSANVAAATNATLVPTAQPKGVVSFKETINITNAEAVALSVTTSSKKSKSKSSSKKSKVSLESVPHGTISADGIAFNPIPAIEGPPKVQVGTLSIQTPIEAKDEDSKPSKAKASTISKQKKGTVTPALPSSLSGGTAKRSKKKKSEFIQSSPKAPLLSQHSAVPLHAGSYSVPIMYPSIPPPSHTAAPSTSIGVLPMASTSTPAALPLLVLPPPATKQNPSSPISGDVNPPLPTAIMMEGIMTSPAVRSKTKQAPAPAVAVGIAEAAAPAPATKTKRPSKKKAPQPKAAAPNASDIGGGGEGRTLS